MLSPLTSEHLDAATALYESAFPQVERRPTQQWHRLLNHEKDFHARILTTAEGQLASLVTFWTFPQFAYVEHFATCPALRGGGIGGRVIDELTHTFFPQQPVVLEVEEGGNSLADRRIGFYTRHGFSLVPKPYRQPPYAGGLDWISLLLMSTQPDFATAHFDLIKATLYGRVYGVSEK